MKLDYSKTINEQLGTFNYYRNRYASYELELMRNRQQISQLTNNWNEARRHIKEYLEEWEDSDDEWVKGKCDMARDILYDMEEIKGENNEQNN